jgi:hypothetical protein
VIQGLGAEHPGPDSKSIWRKSLGAGHHVEALLVEEGLAHPRAVRPVIEARGVAVGGDGDRAVLAVIGDLPPGDGASPVRIVGQRVAIGVIGDRPIVGPMSANGGCQVNAILVQAVLSLNVGGQLDFRLNCSVN